MMHLAIGSILLLLVNIAVATQTLQETGVGRQLLGAETYKQGEDVDLWASKVGPFSNPRYEIFCLGDLGSTL